ncbi:MAG: 23S rRNA (guanosine(2251)-2'-O)-methyltransferase RlmB [Gammaproteobacteria bacterium]
MTKTLTVYGVHVVSAILNTDPIRVKQLWVQQSRNDDARLQPVLTMAKAASIAIQSLNPDSFKKRFSGVHQGVVAEIVPLPQLTEADLFSLLESLQTPPFLLILDGVEDPHNLGACLRSANAAGVHAVIAPKDHAVGLTAVVRKTASGAAELTPFIQVTNLARCLRELKARGIWLFGASEHGETNLYQTDLMGPMAWVLGAEGSGLRRLTATECDALVSIPMLGSVNSLNVSVATGVCLFETVRQRGLAQK